MANRVQEFLEKIRTLNGLRHAILCGITLWKREMTAEFLLVTDRAYSTMDEASAKEICEEFLPAGFSACVKIVKRTPDAEMVKTRIYEYVRKAFPAACAFLGYDNIEVEMLSSGAHFYVDIASGEQTLFESGKILDEISRYLMSVFCGTFYGNVRIVEKDARDETLLEEVPESKEESVVQEIRKFPICEYAKIDGYDGAPLKEAVYIADCSMQDGVYSVCGTVQFIEEISYTRHNEKTGEDVAKTRFSLSINDGTGNLRTTYFPKKATVEKVREVKIGDKIVITGANEEYNGSRSFKASKLNYGQPPEGFVPEARKGKPVPKFYHTVFPEEYVDYTQTGLFDDLTKPDDLKNNVFVCFDLETTGLNNNPATVYLPCIYRISTVYLP